jgi:hypothetical protein
VLGDPICQFSPSRCANGFGAAVAAGDFDGDGVSDLAVGMPDANDRAGQVELYRGSASGLGLSGYLAQGSQGFNGAPEQDDEFGAALGAWNWGRGSQADLAIGVPGEDIGSVKDAGLVQVVYGSSTGLITSGMQSLTEDQVGRAVTAGNQFGFALY